jgi:cellobiose phosphorylase
MRAAENHLVDREHRLIKVLDPPFNLTTADPGYIKGYLPGVRENGGQYTHAAVWMAMAFAHLGDRERTWEMLELINPIRHGSTPEEISVYKAEPYVVAADIYSVDPHRGRGGWSWYTGSAGWMYQLIMESFLGLKRQGTLLCIEPCVPQHWKSFSLTYRFKTTPYNISVTVSGEDMLPEVIVDGVVQTDGSVHLQEDGLPHTVTIRVSGKRPAVVKEELALSTKLHE